MEDQIIRQNLEWIHQGHTTLKTGEWDSFAAPHLEGHEWSVIIPAAGRGSRLGFHLPKILYQVAGRPILDWLLDLFPAKAKIILVASSTGAAALRDALIQRGTRGQVVIQPEPKGMGHAVAIGLAVVDTPRVAIVWGDQTALLPEHVSMTLRLHSGPLSPDVTCPTVLRSKPYIHFERDAAGRLKAILQAREGDAMPADGESDAGFFAFETAVLRRLWQDHSADVSLSGALTKEQNFLPLIALASAVGLQVLTPQVMTVEETTGVNSADDAEMLTTILENRK